MIFDRYIAVDWSASSLPKVGKDSIWICELSAEGRSRSMNPSTRGMAEVAVRDLLLRAADRSQRVLVSFDFPYAYPAGFAAALGLNGQPWNAVWDFLERAIRDDPITNRSNRFEVASAINARLTHHAFWGRPARQHFEHLSTRPDVARYRIAGEEPGLPEWRQVELLLRSRRSFPQSAWKLMGAGSVGSQALTGIPVVSRLRKDPRLKAVSKVWPFEVMTPEPPARRAAIIHAEIWPSLLPLVRVDGQVRDETQVTSLAHELRTRDQEDRLVELFAAAGPRSEEEGWILGVA